MEERGSGVSLHGSNRKPSMSALGQKRTSKQVCAMSALPPKADIVQHGGNVRFVPKADSRTATRNCYSNTLSAMARSVGGTFNPSALAVLRLMTNSYLAGA